MKNSKISKKAKTFLDGLQKYRDGGMQVPLPEYQDGVLAPMAPDPNWINYDPSLIQGPELFAYPNQNPMSIQPPMAINPPIQNPIPTPKPKPNFNAIPVIGSAITLGMGIKEGVESYQAKKRSDRLRGYFDQDLAERKKDISLGEYVNTPYSQYQDGGIKLGERVSNFRATDSSQSGTTAGADKMEKAKLSAAQQKENQRILAERKARMERSKAAKGKPISAQQIADESAAIGDKFRVFPDDPNSVVDALNPLVMIGDMAAGLGQVPLNIQEGNYGQAAMNVSMPLLAGALAGGKNAAQLANNLINPLAGTGEFLTTQTPLRNAYKLNPFAFKPNSEAYYRMVGKDGLTDAIESGIIRANPKTGKFNAPYFSKGQPSGSYAGPNMVEYKADDVIFPKQSFFDYASPLETINIENPNLKFYTQDWLRGFKEVPKQLSNFSKFKSEIDWSKWNADTPKFPELINEYNAIEESTKKAGTWMKNPDGSDFQGSPEQFIQQQSSFFKKAFPDYYGEILNHNSPNKFDKFNNKFFGTTTDRGWYGEGLYTHPSERYTQGYGINNYKLYVNSKNKGFINKDNYNASKSYNRNYDKELKNLKKKKELQIKEIYENPNDYKDAEFWKTAIEKQYNNNKKRLLEEQQEGLNYNINQYSSLTNPHNGEVVIPFNNRVKSAVGNVGFFDMSNPNIYKSLLPAAAAVGASQKMQEVEELPRAKEGGIHIDPKNKGKFTAAAKRRGMGVQEFANKVMANKEDYSPLLVKRANFARNAAKWEDGGLYPTVSSDYNTTVELANQRQAQAMDLLQKMREVEELHKMMYGGMYQNGGMFPSWMNPKNWGVTDYSDKGDFNTAFFEAKKAGEEEFMYNNKRYNTKSDLTPEQQMKAYGITDKQRILNPSTYRKNLSNLNTADGYDTPISDIVNRALGKNEGEDFSSEPNSPIAKEQDALRLYLGLPQKANTFRPSRYKKDAFELTGYNEMLPDEMPSDEEVNFYGKPLSQDDFIKTKGSLKNVKVAENYSGNTLKPLEDFVMGKHTVRKGKDDRGEYLEYIDNFDFDTYKYNNIPVGEIGDKFNKPYSIYGRKYYKDYGDGVKKAMYYTDKELSELDINKKNFDTLALQRELGNRGYKLPKSTRKDGTFDGIMGDETKKALLEYRKSQDKQEFKGGGEMIKRADGSYSRRGLWDNIRDNRGSGKKPTKEMLKQERKIRREEMEYGGYMPFMDSMDENNQYMDLPEFGNGGYKVERSNDRKGKTHKVTGPDGSVKYFGDPNMGERSKSKYGKEAFYARHKSNLEKNPHFRAYARATWQNGGQVGLEGFGQMYDNQQAYNQQTQQQFEDFYNRLNQQNVANWRNMRTSAINNIVSGVGGLASAGIGLPGMQNGGEYDPTLDVNSTQFDADAFMGREKGQPSELDALIEAEQAKQMQRNETEMELMNFITEGADTGQANYSNLGMFANNPSSGSGSSSLAGAGEFANVIDEIRYRESRGNYGRVNDVSKTTGAYQFMPIWWADQIQDFMGIDPSASQEEVMEAFRTNPQAQDKFMVHVVNNIYKPQLPKLRPYAQKYGLNDDQLIKLMHYRGVGDAIKRLKTGDFSVSAEEKAKYNNPDIMEYLKGSIPK